MSEDKDNFTIDFMIINIMILPNSTRSGWFLGKAFNWLPKGRGKVLVIFRKSSGRLFAKLFARFLIFCHLFPQDYVHSPVVKV